MNEMDVMRRRGGRPPRADVRSTRRVEFVVTTEERQALDRVARSQGYRSVAAAVRDAVNSFCDDFGGVMVFGGRDRKG